ncbi:MAG: (2Fe-2S)-binding protein, partial [Nocardioides sp.]|nr:(2Fe-2S)-binding protein [Nocardioides sp.]
MTHRLAPQSGELIDRSTSFGFAWNGRTFSAHPGDTIASALAANGVDVFSRSFKYHRPRGLLTASYHDPGCLVQVGDEPNVRGAHRLVEPGMSVSSQDTWPSLALDVKAVNEVARRALPAGFYYKTFMSPGRLWPAYERVLERFAHGGTPPAEDAPPGRFDKRHAHPDVLVAGGG